MTFNSQHAVIIPAYKPGNGIIELVNRLVELNAQTIIIVNDGSGPEFDMIFDKLKAQGECVVLEHEINLGKGRALKTAYNFILSEMNDIKGAVMADADGQHTPQDILSCSKALELCPTAMIMGCRSFKSDDIPFKSKFGNKMTCIAMKSMCQISVSDTQTGLRALSTDFMARLLNVTGDRYEFETNMLLETRRAQVPIKEVPISTIYINNNESSHFHPLRDSIKIYALLFKFVTASFASSIVDIILFSLLVMLLRPFDITYYIAIATVAARVISALFNYTANKKFVFESKKSTKSSGAKYIVLCIAQVALSAFLVTVLFGVLPFKEFVIKIIVDILLFLISFQIQSRLIF